MRGLITLELQAPDDSLEYASSLPVLKDLQIDRDYGLVAISPKRHKLTVGSAIFPCNDFVTPIN